mmetsp:Transcript_30272/g.69373  ORF Transcript_30272/g.69373 Transcript_30272/m.69373 type:complete len:328 (-) Transcript_30272:39-1022(-)
MFLFLHPYEKGIYDVSGMFPQRLAQLRDVAQNLRLMCRTAHFFAISVHLVLERGEEKIGGRMFLKHYVAVSDKKFAGRIEGGNGHKFFQQVRMSGGERMIVEGGVVFGRCRRGGGGFIVGSGRFRREDGRRFRCSGGGRFQSRFFRGRFRLLGDLFLLFFFRPLLSKGRTRSFRRIRSPRPTWSRTSFRPPRDRYYPRSTSYSFRNRRAVSASLRRPPRSREARHPKSDGRPARRRPNPSRLRRTLSDWRGRGEFRGCVRRFSSSFRLSLSCRPPRDPRVRHGSDVSFETMIPFRCSDGSPPHRRLFQCDPIWSSQTVSPFLQYKYR